MTIQKQLSHLSFAAIMLVFAALPALAQTGSVDNQTAVATTLHRNHLSIPPKESTIVVAPAVTEKQPSLSATQFMQAVTEPAVITGGKVFESTSLDKPGKTLNETASKSITFVPSRGPKLPWQ
jgi:hypothetical protein